MPIYEYRCDACGEQLEIIHSMSDDSERECPKCGASPLSRLISRSSFALKGSGWYKDLYSSSKPASGGGDSKKGTKASGD